MSFHSQFLETGPHEKSKQTDQFQFQTLKIVNFINKPIRLLRTNS